MNNSSNFLGFLVLLIFLNSFSPILHSQSNGAAPPTNILSAAFSNSTLSTVYTETKCGLNYVHGEVTLNQRRGAINSGQAQPASITINGIPTNAVIEQAFLYYSIEGIDASWPSFSFSVTNPDGAVTSFISEPVRFGPSACWDTSGSATFRNDLTSIITGNGTYDLLGLPAYFIPTDRPDVNGASLMIIYSDPVATFTGTIIVNDGHEVSTMNRMNITCDVTGFSVPTTIQNSKGFLIMSDDQDFEPNIISIDGTQLNFINNDAFVFAENTIALVAGQTSSVHEINRTGEDCISLSMTGIYYQDSDISTCAPIVTEIPTIGQWGLIALALLLLIISTVQMRSVKTTRSY